MNRLLLEGTRGGGKTDVQLMMFRSQVGKGYGQYWRGIIFDREYKMLDDLVSKSRRWFPQFGDGAEFKAAKSDYKWVWPTGEELMFRSLKAPEDYWNYHGQEFPFIGWNELCKYPLSDCYDVMMSCNRSSFLPDEHSPDPENPLTDIPLFVVSTTNPYGPGHNWVKRTMIDSAPPGVITERKHVVYDPRINKERELTIKQVRIFSSFMENRYLDATYIATLMEEKDPNRRKAWLTGDWNIVAGGALDDVWRDHVHMIPAFRIPAEWSLFRSFDWGSTRPFSVGWWAVCNGEEVTLLDGKKRTFPRGTLIRINEWYGAQDIDGSLVGHNRGLKMSNPAIAKGIKAREATMLEDKWIASGVLPGPADSSIFDEYTNEQGATDSIAIQMSKHGVQWTKANKKPGSRKNGLQVVRDRLQASIDREGRGMYFFQCCKVSNTTLPVLPRDEKDPDDVDTDAEDHCYDEVRYTCLTGGSVAAREIEIDFPI